MDWKRNKILKVSKNSGHILSCLWTKVHEDLGLCRGPLVLSKAFAQLSMSCYVQKIFAIKSRSRRKIEQNVKVFWLPVLGGIIQIFLRQIVSAIYYPSFGKV